MADELQKKDITCEMWREYDFAGRAYRITDPIALYYHPGGTTHRVVGPGGIVHCLPAPGIGDCVLRWQPRDPTKPVQF